MTDRKSIITAVKALFVHRVLTILAWAGLFVAGVLTVAHTMGKDLPCGVADGCNKLAEDPSSRWFGVPVAVFGLAAYMTFAVFGILRARMGLAQARPIIVLGMAMSGIGLLLSVYLQYVSIVELGSPCPWCISSAVIMLLTFLLHSGLAQMTLPEEPVPGGDKLMTTVCAIVALGAVGMQVKTLADRKAGKMTKIELSATLSPTEVVKDKRMWEGPEDAPISIIEYADVFCPGCRASYIDVKALVDRNATKIRYSFQNFPLYENSDHKFSATAALAIVYAAEHDKYFQMVDKFFRTSKDAINSFEGILAAAKDIGLDAEDLKTRITSRDPSLLLQVGEQRQMAQTLKLGQTPTFYVFAKGLKPRAVGAKELSEMMMQPPYSNLLENGPVAK